MSKPAWSSSSRIVLCRCYVWAISASIVLTNIASYGQTTNRLQWAKPVVLPKTAAEGDALLAARLDTDLYRTTRIGFPDVRLLDQAGTEVPFLLRRARDKRTIIDKQLWQPKEISLKPLDNNGLEITCEIDTQRYPQWPSGIRLHSPVRNFEHGIRLETSANGSDWQLLIEDLIFDYSQFMPIRDTEILLPRPTDNPLSAGPSFYRLTIDEVTQAQQSQLLELTRDLQGEEEITRSERIVVNRQPFRIDRIEFWQDEFQREVPTDVEVEHSYSVDRVETDGEAQETHVYFSTQREPLTSVSLKTEATNFSRSARVEVRRAADGIRARESSENEWLTLGSAQLKRFSFRTLQEEQLKVSFAEKRATEYRLVIVNADSPPLSIDSIVGMGPAYEAVFLATRGTEYRLAYNSPSLKKPSYDTKAVEASLREGYLPKSVSLGAATKLEMAAAPEDPVWQQLLGNGPLVVFVIAILVLVLGVGLYRAAREIESS